MTKQAMVIVNPVSSNGKTGVNWPHIKTNLEKTALEFDFVLTACRLEATCLARQALHNGYDTIVAVGGDGTLNEVVNGFFENDRLINSSAKLGLIAGGTGSDFIRTLKYPPEYSQACKLIARGQTKLIDLGKVEFTDHNNQPGARYYINLAGFGMDGAVVERVNRTSKFFGGFLSFLYGTLAALAQFQNFSLSLEVDGKLVYQGPATMAAVANGQFFGGSMQIAPGAVLDDGIMEVVIVEGIGKAKILSCLPKIYKGAHGQYPQVKFMRATTVKAASPHRVLLDVDGEQPGILNAEFTILPKVLNIIC